MSERKIAEIYYDLSAGRFTVRNLMSGIEGRGPDPESAIQNMRQNTPEWSDVPPSPHFDWQANFLLSRVVGVGSYGATGRCMGRGGERNE